MQEDDGGLGGAEHDDAVDGRDVDAFVEEVDDAEGVEVATLESSHALGSIAGAGRGEDGLNANAALGEPARGEAGMLDGAAEDEGAGAGVLAPGAPQALHALLGLRGGGESRGVEAAVLPGDVRVVDVVAHAVVGEGDEAASLDGEAEVGAIGDEVVEQAEDVAGVATVRGRREAEQEAGLESLEDAAVGGGVGVVGLVEDDVVEGLGGDAGEVVGSAELLDGGDDDGGVVLHEVAGAPADGSGLVRVGEHAAEGAGGLGQELFAVGEEEHAGPGAGGVRDLGDVERGEPGLAQAGREHHERDLAALLAGAGEGGEGLALELVGRGWGLEWFGLAVAERQGSRRLAHAPRVGLDPALRQVDRGGPERVDGCSDAIVCDRVDGALDAQVPLDTGLERGAREVACCRRTRRPSCRTRRARIWDETPARTRRATRSRRRGRGSGRGVR